MRFSFLKKICCEVNKIKKLILQLIICKIELYLFWFLKKCNLTQTEHINDGIKMIDEFKSVSKKQSGFWERHDIKIKAKVLIAIGSQSFPYVTM